MVQVSSLFDQKTPKYSETLTIFYTKSVKICPKYQLFYIKYAKIYSKMTTFLDSFVNFFRPSVGAGGISLGNAYISNSGLTKNYKNGQFFKKKSSFFV